MPALSATAVQKTLKVETTTIYARASLSANGQVITLITGSVTGGNPGASKGVLSATTGSAGEYTFEIDPSIPVQQFLGAPSSIFLNANATATDPGWIMKLKSATLGQPSANIGAKLTLATLASGATTPSYATSSAGQELWVSIPFTTSKVF